MPGVGGERACPVSVCGRWEFLLWRGPLIFCGACPCCRLLGGNHFVVTRATAVAHASLGDHASRAWWQVVLRALKHGQASHLPWCVVPHTAACFCRFVEPTASETRWACVLCTSAFSLERCERTVCRGLKFAFDGGVWGLWDFTVPHGRKKVFGKGAVGASFPLVCASVTYGDWHGGTFLLPCSNWSVLFRAWGGGG